jgi:hypothetical protein
MPPVKTPFSMTPAVPFARGAHRYPLPSGFVSSPKSSAFVTIPETDVDADTFTMLDSDDVSVTVDAVVDT